MFDLVGEMLQLGQRKIVEAGVAQSVTLTQGNLVALPYADSIFDAVINLSAPHRVAEIGYLPRNHLLVR